MASSVYDETCKNCGLNNISVWLEVRRNIDGIPCLKFGVRLYTWN